jgi:hypothetical protein
MTAPFKERISYCNQLLFPLGLYPAFQVPAGVTVPAPFIVTRSVMDRLARPSGRSISTTAGYVRPTFHMRFANFTAQWRRLSGQPARRQFTGGTVYLDLTLAVYVQQRYSADDVITIILEHEMLHVADEIDIVKNYLPREFQNEAMINNYLIQKQPLLERTFQHYFVPRSGQPSRLQELVHNIWAAEHNRRGNRRDSDAEYHRYNRRVSLAFSPSAQTRTAIDPAKLPPCAQP